MAYRFQDLCTEVITYSPKKVGFRGSRQGLGFRELQMFWFVRICPCFEGSGPGSDIRCNIGALIIRIGFGGP